MSRAPRKSGHIFTLDIPAFVTISASGQGTWFPVHHELFPSSWLALSTVDKSYGKIGESSCREWNYLCAGRGWYLLSGFTVARENKL